MAAYLVNQRIAANAKSSFTLLSILTKEQKYSSDNSQKKNNLYETLGIPSSATQIEIKKAYYDLTLKYHPDKNVNNEEAALKFREVSEAYEILGNYRSRKRYDRGLPTSDVNKVIKHAVDHKSEYQEFFDSRSTKERRYTDPRMQEMSDLGSYTEKKNREEATAEKSNDKPSSAVQAVFGVFLILIIFFSRS